MRSTKQNKAGETKIDQEPLALNPLSAPQQSDRTAPDPPAACRPTSLPTEPLLVKSSPSMTRLRSKAKPRLNAASGCYLSVILLFSVPCFFFSFLSVYWHPVCYGTVSLPQQSSLTSAAYARIGQHVADVRCAVDESSCEVAIFASRASLIMCGNPLRLSGLQEASWWGKFRFLRTLLLHRLFSTSQSHHTLRLSSPHT